jgi:hypothetical protein
MICVKFSVNRDCRIDPEPKRFGRAAPGVFLHFQSEYEGVEERSRNKEETKKLTKVFEYIMQYVENNY